MICYGSGFTTRPSVCPIFFLWPPGSLTLAAGRESCASWRRSHGWVDRPLTATIVGTGFGYLPTILPYVMQTSPYLEINDTAGTTTKWDTGTGSGGASCQMYIANWTDTSISIVANAPINPFNLYIGSGAGKWLSPLTDFSPLTLFTNSNNTWICPVANGDRLTFTVTNPQHPGSGSYSEVVCVGTPGAAPPTCPT